MKPASLLPKTLIGLLLLFSISSFKQVTQQEIQGTWEVYKYEIEKTVNNSDNVSAKVVGTIFVFDDCSLTISSKGTKEKSGEYSLIGNKLTIGLDQPAAEIILLTETELKIKLPFQQGILYLNRISLNCKR